MVSEHKNEASKTETESFHRVDEPAASLDREGRLADDRST